MSLHRTLSCLPINTDVLMYFMMYSITAVLPGCDGQDIQGCTDTDNDPDNRECLDGYFPITVEKCLCK